MCVCECVCVCVCVGTPCADTRERTNDFESQQRKHGDTAYNQGDVHDMYGIKLVCSAYLLSWFEFELLVEK